MTVLVTGATGQDGIILSHFLRRDAADVAALVRPGADASQLLGYAPGVNLVECDLADHEELASVVRAIAPSKVFHLGGITSPMFSVDNDQLTWHVNVGSLMVLLECLEDLRKGTALEPRLLFACSGSIFEGSQKAPQNEDTPPVPMTPYAKSKAEGWRLIREARDSGLFASAAVLYNHESPLRGASFVTGKVAAGVARIASGIQDTLHLGALGARRDWGWAPDYVTGMLLMMEASRPDDWVLATGRARTVSDLLDAAFAAVGIENWNGMVTSDRGLMRDVDSTSLVGDSSRAQAELGWRMTKSFQEIIETMVRHQAALLEDSDALWQIPKRRPSQ